MDYFERFIFKKTLGFAITGILIAASAGLICNREGRVSFILPEDPETLEKMDPGTLKMLEEIKKSYGIEEK